VSYAHSQIYVGPGQSVIVELDRAANVQVMSGSDHARYRRGERHQYYGGRYTSSPAVIKTPPGYWHVAIDLGVSTGTIRASVSVR